MHQRIFSELMNDRLEPDVCHHVVELDSSPIIIHGSDSESDEESISSKVNTRLTTTFPDGFPGPSSHQDTSHQPEVAARKMKTELRTPSSSQAAGVVDEEIASSLTMEMKMNIGSLMYLVAWWGCGL